VRSGYRSETGREERGRPEDSDDDRNGSEEDGRLGNTDKGEWVHVVLELEARRMPVLVLHRPATLARLGPVGDFGGIWLDMVSPPPPAHPQKSRPTVAGRLDAW